MDVHALTKIVLVSIGVWWLTLIALFLFPVSFLSWFALLVSLLAAIVLVILSFVALFKDKRRLWPILSMVIVVLTVYVAHVHLTYLGAFANLYFHRRYYESTAIHCLLRAQMPSANKFVETIVGSCRQTRRESLFIMSMDS